MLKPGHTLIGLLILLVGCSSAPRRAGKSRAPDWNSAGDVQEIEQVSDAPKLAPPPASTAPPARAPVATTEVPWISLEHWNSENRIGALRQISLTPLPTYALTTSNGALVVQTRSRVARWNGMELHFGFEPQLIDGRPFVHRLDLKKNIEPLLTSFALPKKTSRVIVIDPGHGGQNPGTRSVADNVDEKAFTLDWALRLADLLATNNWQVFLTRTNDIDVSLSNRVAQAEQRQADLFVSLHFNSPGESQAGVETYCLTPTGMSSTLIREFEDNTSLVCPNNAFDTQNLQLAMKLHEAMLRVSGMADHGVRRARFMTVLRGQNRPAVLIEGGYLSNPREARRIADPAYRQKLAEAVAAALGCDDETDPVEGEH